MQLKDYNTMIRSMSLGIKKLSYDSILPTRGSDGAVGYDLYSDMECVIRPSERGLVSTGIAVVLPSGVYGRVAPRSGLAVKHGIQVGAGVIDPDYTGEVKVVLFNHGDKDFEVKKGDRIAQLVLERCETPPVKEIEIIEETDRGSGGFGSTGK
jgi:dUTP pyrophosphatase